MSMKVIIVRIMVLGVLVMSQVLNWIVLKQKSIVITITTSIRGVKHLRTIQKSVD